MDNTLSIPAPAELRPLTNKMKLLADNFIVMKDPVKAAKRSGYRSTTSIRRAYLILQKPNVQKYIQEMEEYVKERALVTKEYLTFHAKDVVESRFTKDNDKISALTFLAKLHGHLKESPDARQTVIFTQTGLLDEAIDVTPTK